MATSLCRNSNLFLCQCLENRPQRLCSSENSICNANRQKKPSRDDDDDDDDGNNGNDDDDDDDNDDDDVMAMIKRFNFVSLLR